MPVNDRAGHYAGVIFFSAHNGIIHESLKTRSEKAATQLIIKYYKVNYI